MITILQGSKRYTAGELARELEVSRRTVFRDLNMLEMAHVPYYFDSDGEGYRISQHFFLPPVNLTLPEALAVLMLAVLMLAGRLRSSQKLPLLEHAARAAVKLESVLPEAIRSHVGRVIDHVQLSLGAVSRHEGLDGTFHDLAGAIVAHNVCRMVYISFDERKQIVTDINPLRLAFLGRAWYLIAHSARHGEVRTFKLARIRKLTVTGRTFRLPPGVRQGECFGDAWSMIPEGRTYDVQIHFDPKVAGNVAEVRWHRTQKVQWNDDGSMEFRARVDGIGEIAWWVLGYGEHAEVIAPQALRHRIRQAAGEMSRRYAERPMGQV